LDEARAEYQAIAARFPSTDPFHEAAVHNEAVARGMIEQLTAASGSSQNPGGIDFNPDLIDLRSSGETITVLPSDVNLQDLETLPINGFVPVILNIIPATNLPLFLSDRTPSNPNLSLAR
jgi:hypothetical protein